MILHKQKSYGVFILFYCLQLDGIIVSTYIINIEPSQSVSYLTILLEEYGEIMLNVSVLNYCFGTALKSI